MKKNKTDITKLIELILFGISLITILTVFTIQYLIQNFSLDHLLIFCTNTAIISFLLFIIPKGFFDSHFFDPEEEKPNTSKTSLVYKFRLRAILFNNISVAIFFFTILVILTSFYLLVFPPIVSKAVENNYLSTSDPNYLPTSLTIRIGSSVLLIFLVQILFRVFKYLLRVAAFYNAKADAIEFDIIDPKLGLEKLMTLLTPDKYDISDLQSPSGSENFFDILKSKLMK